MTAVRQGSIWSLDFIADILTVPDDENPAKYFLLLTVVSADNAPDGIPIVYE
jgi:hypothetical protein